VAVGTADAVGVGVGPGVPSGVGVGVAVPIGVAVGTRCRSRGGSRSRRGPAGATVVTAKLHPPAKLPRSPGPSSKTYNDHIPLGTVPLKADNAAANGATGRVQESCLRRAMHQNSQ
jgi:hypothetical protein